MQSTRLSQYGLECLNKYVFRSFLKTSTKFIERRSRGSSFQSLDVTGSERFFPNNLTLWAELKGLIRSAI